MGEEQGRDVKGDQIWNRFSTKQMIQPGEENEEVRGQDLSNHQQHGKKQNDKK